MQRFVYRAQCRDGAEIGLVSFLSGRKTALEEYIDKGQLITLSVFKWKNNIFTYYECIDRSIHPEELFGGMDNLLEKWPGEDEPRCWVPMMDIYHCCEPVNKEYWQRKLPVKKAYARVNRLRPEMVSSYIFYHYQYQEEKPGDWSKYPSIYLYENLMFFYMEEPDGPEVPPYKGKLKTSNTPGQWGELMNEHFLPWEDDPQIKNPWRETEQLLYL